MSKGPPDLGGPAPPGSGQGGGFNFDPVSWLWSQAEGTVHEVESTVTWGAGQVDSLWVKAGSTILHGVSSAVEHFVNVGVHVLESLVLRVIGIIHHMVADLFVLVHDAAKAAQGPIDWIKHSESWLASGLVRFGDQVDNTIIKPAIAAAVRGLHDAASAVTEVVKGIQHFDTWVVNDVIQPIQQELAHLGDLAEKAAHSLLATFEKDVIDPVVAEVKTIGTTVDGIAKVLTADTVKALQELGEIGGWVVWLAEHTVADVEQIPQDLYDAAHLSTMLAGAKAESGQLSTLETMVKDFLDS